MKICHTKKVVLAFAFASLLPHLSLAQGRAGGLNTLVEETTATLRLYYPQAIGTFQIHRPKDIDEVSYYAEFLGSHLTDFESFPDVISVLPGTNLKDSFLDYPTWMRISKEDLSTKWVLEVDQTHFNKQYYSLSEEQRRRIILQALFHEACHYVIFQDPNFVSHSEFQHKTNEQYCVNFSRAIVRYLPDLLMSAPASSERIEQIRDIPNQLLFRGEKPMSQWDADKTCAEYKTKYGKDFFQVICVLDGKWVMGIQTKNSYNFSLPTGPFHTANILKTAPYPYVIIDGNIYFNNALEYNKENINSYNRGSSIDPSDIYWGGVSALPPLLRIQNVSLVPERPIFNVTIYGVKKITNPKTIEQSESVYTSEFEAAEKCMQTVKLKLDAKDYKFFNAYCEVLASENGFKYLIGSFSPYAQKKLK